jgi:ribonuclease J
VGAAQERLVVALFSSNVHRLGVLLAAARQAGRKVCLLGRSLVRQVEAARAIGRLEVPSDALVAPSLARDLPRAQILVLAGGSQAEAPSSLRRLSLGTHRDLALEAGDEVVFSSRVIPGNERPVMRMMNDLLRMGVRVRSRLTDGDLHTSGHAARSEQRHMLELVRPRGFIPVHGTLHHLTKHRELAESTGVLDTAVVENGTPVWIAADAPLAPEERVPHGAVRVAFGGLELDAETRRKRLDLARSGVLTVAVAVDERGFLLGKPAVTSYGIPGVDDHPGALSRLQGAVEGAVQEGRQRPGPPLTAAVRRAARRIVQEVSGVRAVVEVNVLRVE